MDARELARVCQLSGRASGSDGALVGSTTAGGGGSVARGIAETCTSSGVTVNSVLPGPTRTEGVATFFGRLAEEQGVSVEEAERAFFANARPTSIIKRLIDPAEVAAMVTYVCSPLSSATHGAALRVEGGVVRSMV